MKKNWNSTQLEEYDSNIAHLTKHMQALRESVPVNYELKAALKKRLLEQLKLKGLEQSKPRKKIANKLFVVISVLALLSLFTIMLLTPFQDQWKVTEWNEVASFSLADQPSKPSIPMEDLHPVTISPDGNQIVLQVGGKLLFIDEEKGVRPLLKGSYSGTFSQPVWARQHQMLAVRYTEGDNQQIWLIQLTSPVSTRLLFSTEDREIATLDWLEQDNYLEATVTTQSGEETIWLGLDGRMHQSRVLEERVDQAQVREQSKEERTASLEKTVELEQINWSKEQEKIIAMADKYWYDWNKERNVFGLVIQQQDDVHVYLVKLKRQR